MRRKFIYRFCGVLAVAATLTLGWRHDVDVDGSHRASPSVTALPSSTSVTAALKGALDLPRPLSPTSTSDVNGKCSRHQAIRSKDIPRIDVPFPFKGPIAPFVEELKERARAGGVDGVHAAHAVSEALHPCVSWLNFPSEEPAPYSEQICAGLTKEEVNKDIAYYAQYAADSAYIPAQVQYGNFVGSTLGSDVSAETLFTYQQRWVKYRVDAILQGSTDAMALTA